MTPDQLQNYVDAAFKQRDSFTVIYFTAVPVLSLVFAFVGTYLKEKGKNAATREDIDHITRKVELIKHEFTANVERLRAGLDRATHITKQQFDAEFGIYRDIWGKLVTVRQTFFALRSFVSDLLPPEASQERLRLRIDAFNTAYGEFVDTVDRNQPFYSDDVYQALTAIIDVCIDEKIESEFTGAETNYWQRVRDNKQKLLKATDDACTTIRRRFHNIIFQRD